MRFLTLELIKYGPFTDAVLDFSEPERAVHLVYGPNEAGKSSTLRAVTGLLYGIDLRTEDAHRHEMGELKVGARLVNSHGEELSIVRRKGRDKTLLNREGGVMDEARLRKMLGGATKESFTLMFGLNHETLRAGAHDLLAGKGNASETLFGAGLGSGFHSALEQLKKEADEIYTKQARVRPLNEALRQFGEAQKRAREYSIASDDWIKQKKLLEEAEAERKGVDEAIRERSAALHRLQRNGQLLPMFASRRALLAQKAALADAPRLPEHAGRDREQAASAERDALDAMDRVSNEIAILKERTDGLVIPVELLAAKEALEEIRAGLPIYKRTQSELPPMRIEMEGLRREVQSLFARIRPGAGKDADAGFTLDSAALARVKKAAQKQTLAESTLVSARRAAGEVAFRMAEEQKQMAGLPPPRDASALQRIAKLIQREGDVDQRLRGLLAEHERLSVAARTKLSALPLWTGSLAELAALPVPALEVTDRAALEWAEIQQHEKRIASEAAKAKQTLSQLSRELDELRMAGEVPTEDELKQVRARRDEAWEKLRREGAGRGKGKGQADNLMGLTEEFEQQLRWADVVSDRLRREAERVTKRAALMASQNAWEREINRIEQERYEIEARKAAQKAQWSRLWAPCGIEPLAPAEMRSFLHQHGALLLQAEKIRENEHEQNLTRRLIEASVGEIKGALSGISAPPPALERSGELRPWLAFAEQAVADIERIEHQRNQCKAALEELSRQERRQREEERQAEETRRGCREVWAAELGSAGLPQNASGEEVAARAAEVEQWIKLRAELRDKEARSLALEKEATVFAEKVRRLVSAHAPPLAKAAAEHAANELLARFQEAVEMAAEKKRIERDLSVREHEKALQSHRIESSRKRLSGLMAAAGVSDLAALEAAEERSREAQTIERRLRELDEQLAGMGEGADIGTLEAELRVIDRDRLAADIAYHKTELAALDAKKRELHERIGRIDGEIGRLSGESKAAEAAAEAQEHLARARGQLDKYLRARLSVMVLEREMERYREQNQGPILKHASELFGRLTHGRFSALRVDYDQNDRAVLQCVRNDGRTVKVEGLSDGTRDQLFLSLRLASLLRYGQNSEPMPLIVDDILVHFDDERAAAALSVLGEVCEHTQVLFFTHHARLRELARAAIAKNRLREHSLVPSI